MKIESQVKFINAGEIGDLLGVKAEHVRRWARQGKIPKLILPNGKFVFDPNAVIDELKSSNQEYQTSLKNELQGAMHE